MKDQWLPIGYKLSNNKSCLRLLYQGELWQIYQLNDNSSSLIVRSELLTKWNDSGILNSDVFSKINYGLFEFFALNSDLRYSLVPLASCATPETKADIQAFASAIKETRSVEMEASFHDAIYMEKYSRLLPTWTLSQNVSDDIVLGSWITGGVHISVTSFRRFKSLTPWLEKSDLKDIIDYAGISVLHTSLDGKKESKTSQINSSDGSQNYTNHERTFSLPGRTELENFFNEYIIDLINNADRYKAFGIDFPSAVILHGLLGCGKTFAVEKLVEFLDWPSFSIDATSVASPYIHDTSKKISEVFDKAIDNSPSVIIIDEMESFLADREASSGQHHVEEVAEFLRRIPEAISKKVIIFGMTNRIEMIDPAILRRGRFDHIIEVAMPSAIEVKSLLNSLLSDIPVVEEIDISALSDDLMGRPMSDTAFVVREAARLAAKTGKSMIDQESIVKALESLPKDKNEVEQSNKIGFI